MNDDIACVSCDALESRVGPLETVWWHCKDYYGFTGYFCSMCYNKIKHDSYGKPTDPEGYLLMVLKFGVSAKDTV